MEQIELVIRLPKKVYDTVMKKERMLIEDDIEIYKAIDNGTLLPKGHGRLKDESDIVAQSVHYFNGTKTLGQCLDDCPTLVEADKEGAEDGKID